MGLSKEIKDTCESMKDKIDSLQYGSVEIMIIGGKIDRIDIRDSIKVNKQG